MRPYDAGTIVYAQGNREAFEVEILEPDGYTIAIATVLPEGESPLADGDISGYRLWKKSAV